YAAKSPPGRSCRGSRQARKTMEGPLLHLCPSAGRHGKTCPPRAHSWPESQDEEVGSRAKPPAHHRQGDERPHHPTVTGVDAPMVLGTALSADERAPLEDIIEAEDDSFYSTLHTGRCTRNGPAAQSW